MYFLFLQVNEINPHTEPGLEAEIYQKQQTLASYIFKHGLAILRT
jgi:hypothetical protein